MKTPYEVFSGFVMPRLRVLVAHKLSSRGASQHKIARLLGVSQAAVNRYLSQDPRSIYRELVSRGFAGREIEAVVEALVNHLAGGDREGYVRLLISVFNKWLIEGLICEVHESLEHVPKGCKICVELKALGVGDPVLNDLNKALEMLRASPNVAQLVPEVMMNIAECRPGARSLADVAAFPGRVVRVGKTITNVAPPAYGVSRHLASIILRIHREAPNLRAIANIRLDDKVLEILEELGIQYVEAKGAVDEEDLALLAVRSEANAVAYKGGPGLEPVTYLISTDAPSLAELIIRVAERYAGRRQD